MSCSLIGTAIDARLGTLSTRPLGPSGLSSSHSGTPCPLRASRELTTTESLRLCSRSETSSPARTCIGDVGGPAVEPHVAVAHELPRRAPRRGEAEAEHDVVETALEHLEQHVARHALGLGGLAEEVAELALEQPVDAARLLLLAQLLAVVRLLDPAA